MQFVLKKLSIAIPEGTMSNLKTVDILGGGPAGLYTAILLRRRQPKTRVRVTEQNPKGATFGFGVVFSDRALDFLRKDDAEIYNLITPDMERWANMVLNHPEGRVVLDGVGFTSIGRLELIEILRIEAEALGVEVRFDTTITDLNDLDGDLVVGADGLNSLVRRSDEGTFKPHMEYFDNRFAWFGADGSFETLTQTFVTTDKGPLNAHHYRYAPDRSTFIVECEAEVFDAYGFAEMDEHHSKSVCEEIFADVLDGRSLITNKSNWRQFPRLWCESWVAGRSVLLGDAAHTAHFSVGSGTRLALEDAIALVDALASEADVDAALAHYQASRPPIAKKIVTAANTSAHWYETFGSKMALPPLAFAYDYLDRSGRMGPDRMREIAPKFMEAYDAWKGQAA
ncbi:MAG: FAD-dependent monooxygenase [Pseudomonadota bacterium]